MTRNNLDRELQIHVELEAEEQRERGLGVNEARFAARRALGNPTQIKERIHELSPWAPLGCLAQDLRYGLRMLRKHAAFTVAVVMTLALGVGSSTALFTIVHNVLLRPLAIPESDRVVLVYNSYP